MSETQKTMLFIGAAVVAMGGAFAVRPSSAELDTDTLVGESLGEFNPEDAKRLKIVAFDEETATLSEFEVAEEDGLWALPSKNGYPADAEAQLADAATNVMDRKILSVVSDNAAEHEQFSVIDPLSPKLAAGQQGVGMHVTMSDINDDALIDLIVGGPVKEAEGQYYVRQAKRDAVYVTEIDPEKLSTKFEDWIEDDLLKINPWDIRQVQINDYSAELLFRGFEAQIDWDRRGEYTLRWDDTDSKWTPVSLKSFDREAREFVDAPLGENETLNEDSLGEMKSALDDLKIVDVNKKPAGLSANLKGGKDFLQDNEAAGSLMRRGFTLVPLKQNELEILSSEGEVICTMKDGVEYVLRFGNLQLATSDESSEPGSSDEAAAEGGADADSGSDGVNRYLFAMVRLNEDMVERPVLESLPELPVESDATDSDAAEGASASGDGEDDVSDSAGAAEDGAAEDGAGDEEADSASDADSEGEDETASEGDESNETSDAGEEGAEDGGSAGDESSDKEAELAEIIADRKRIEEGNQRKLDEFQTTLETGRKRVQDLNIRFGDWYYVIDNSIFQKIRLSRDQLVKEKDPEEAETEEAGAVSEFGAPGTPVQGLPNLGSP